MGLHGSLCSTADGGGERGKRDKWGQRGRVMAQGRVVGIFGGRRIELNKQRQLWTDYFGGRGTRVCDSAKFGNKG